MKKEDKINNSTGLDFNSTESVDILNTDKANSEIGKEKEEKKSKFSVSGCFQKTLLAFLILVIIGYEMYVLGLDTLYKIFEYYNREISNSKKSEPRPFEEDTQKYPKPLTVEDKKKLILQSMKDKYGEEFVGYKWDDKSEDYFRYGESFALYPKNGTEEDRFRVEIDYDSEYNYYFLDNYFEIAIRDRYREYIENILNELYPEYFLTIEKNVDHVYSGRFNKDIKINEIYQPNKQRYGTSIKIYISEQLLNNKNIAGHAYQIAEKMLEHNIDCRVYLHIVKNSKYAYFKEKKGEVYPSKEDPDFYIKREQIDNDFYVREGSMKREYYNIMILPNEKDELLEIKIGTENK